MTTVRGEMDLCPPSASDEASSGKQGSRLNQAAMVGPGRASKLWRHIENAADFYAIALIELALREAENAALERARTAATNVRTFDCKGGDEWASGFVDGKNEAAVAIEHLKHSGLPQPKTSFPDEASKEAEGGHKSIPIPRGK